MYLDQQFVNYRPAQFALPAAACLGTTQKFGVDRSWPVEHIILYVDFVVSVALTLAPATAQSNDAYDNVLTFLKHINLTINPGNGLQSRTVVDIDGIRLLEYCYLTGINLDTGTLNMIQISQGTTLATGAYTLVYMIPCVETMVGEPLRSRLLLPVHKYTQDPVLALTFQTLATIASAGTISSIQTTVQLVRRIVTTESEAILAKTQTTNPWGYIDWDLIQTDYGIAPGAGTGEQRFALPLTGQYATLACSQYFGGANITRNEISLAGIGDTVAHGFGAEERWRLESGLNVIREWYWKQLRYMNQASSPRNNITQTSSPFFGGAVLGSTNFQAPSCVLHNFLNDGITGDNGTELGSLLDCNLAASLKMEMIGKCANVATNSSTLSVAGRRLYGNLAPWSQFA